MGPSSNLSTTSFSCKLRWRMPMQWVPVFSCSSFWRLSLKMSLKAKFVNSGLAVNSGLELDRCCLLVQFSIFAIKRCFADLVSRFALQFAERSLWTIAKISKHRYKYNYGKLTLPHTMLNDADIGYHPCCVLYQATSRPKDKYSLCISMNRYVSFILIVNGFLQSFLSCSFCCLFIGFTVSISTLFRFAH